MNFTADIERCYLLPQGARDNQTRAERDKEKTQRGEKRKRTRDKNQERGHERQETQCNRQDPIDTPAQEAREAGKTKTTESMIKAHKTRPETEAKPETRQRTMKRGVKEINSKRKTMKMV